MRYIVTPDGDSGRHVVRDSDTGKLVRGPYDNRDFANRIADALNGVANPSDAYEPDDPKHPAFHERMSVLWDARPGK